MIDVLSEIKEYLESAGSCGGTVLHEQKDELADARSLTIPDLASIETRWLFRGLYPVMYILPDTTEIDDQQYWPDYSDAKIHRVMISVTHQSTQIEDVTNTILIYAKALELLSINAPRYGERFGHVRIRSITYSEMVASQKAEEAAQSVVLSVNIQTRALPDEQSAIY